MANIIEKLSDVLLPKAIEFGYEIVEIKYEKSELCVYIWKKGGVDLNDCEKFHNAASELLDEFDFTSGAQYTLSISSPGLDRAIVTDDDYRRNLDEDVEIIFYKATGKKKTHGKLVAYSQDEVTLSDGNKQKIYNKKDISVCRPYIKF